MTNLGLYIPGDSPVHTLDPRVKIFTVIALSVAVLHAGPLALTLAFASAIGILRVAGIHPRWLWASVRPVLPFFLLLLLIYIFFTPGQAVKPLTFGFFHATYKGLYQGLLQTGRFLLLVVAGALLPMTTSPTEITMGLEYLLRPLRIVGVSSQNVATMVSVALRFVPILLDETQSAREAQWARGANLSNHSLKSSFEFITRLSIPVLLSAFRHADQLVDAMTARGYHQGPRTYLHDLKLKTPDYIVLAATAAVCAAAAVVSF